MNLPKIATPRFELVVPSTGKTVSYRPYLTKEEKVLMMARESGKEAEIAKAVKQLISDCVDDLGNIDDITSFDFEYIFIKLRAVSVGESANPTLKCSAMTPPVDGETPCNAKIAISVDFASLEPTTHEDHTNKIVLSDGIGVVMKYPTLGMMTAKTTNKTDTETVFDTVVDCIDYVFDDDKIYNGAERSEIVEFVDSLGSTMLQQIQQKFFEAMPSVEVTQTATCSECGKEHTVVLKGLSDFF